MTSRSSPVQVILPFFRHRSTVDGGAVMVLRAIRVLQGIRSFVENPVTNLVKGIALLTIGLSDAYQTVWDDITQRHLRVGHGLIIIGFFSILGSLPHFIESLEAGVRNPGGFGGRRIRRGRRTNHERGGADPVDPRVDLAKSNAPGRLQNRAGMDRTTLAWLRTTLTVAVSFGFGMVAFFRTLRERSPGRDPLA